MANMDEIRNAYNVAAKFKNEDLAFLHCQSNYPVKSEETNLAAIEYLKNELKCEIGWSDHSRDIAVILRAALKWNAKIFEFHLDLDSDGAEYSSGHCWLPSELENVISIIERSKLADGDHKKFPGKSESNDRNWRADPSDGLRPLKKIRESD